ncbi:phospholipid-transporting ATPase ABCA1-like isoform X2 [Ornithodoros turicata]|uniref:phospholipid-transporting ATPase ABCA1-like isoform X2 n=1 Tax=Ornithodoros turicata TaxID=34597 RepID=UPI003138AE07
MGTVAQLLVLLWKNILIQTLRRHPFFTLFQIAATIGVFYIYMSWLADEPPRFIPKYTKAKTYREFSGSPVRAVVYGPNDSSPYTTFILQSGFPDALNYSRLGIDLPGPDGPNSIIQPLIGVSTLQEVKESCTSSHYCFFLTSSGNDADLSYTIVHHDYARYDFAEKADPSYITLGSWPSGKFASLQMKLERSHVVWLAQKKKIDPKTIPTEMLKLMGLSEFVYWVGHLCTSLFITITSCIPIGVILVNVGKFRPTIPGADITLVETALLLFCLHLGMHILFVACLFKRSNVAVTFAIIYWLVASLWPISKVGSTLSQYMTYSRVWKLAYCMTPLIGTYYTILLIGLACDIKGSAGWSVVTVFSEGQDNITILDVWMTMLVTDMAMAILVWYFTRVLPWVTGIPQPFYFPFLRNYWNPIVTVDKVDTAALAARDPARFETDPNAEAVIAIKGLCKNFENNTALNGIDVRFFKGEITVLLGHNGAGKTTMMSILTGILPPTAGTAVICGFDVVKNTASAQKNIALCPQLDIFFPDLTAHEHLAFFCSVRAQLSRKDLEARVSEVLATVNLSAKANELSKALSGGMKRRLSTAIAIVAQPQVVILDEPTAGTDPETRRDLWDMFLSLRKRCTIILSTHDMEEADVLGDRIGIMAHGNLLCWGTPIFLKKAFGTGYQIHLARSGNMKVDMILSIVKQTAPNAEIGSESLTEVTISLGVSDPQGFESMFATLEQQMQNLGIGSIGVTVATMEDVYIKANFEEGNVGMLEVNEAQEAKDEDVQRLCVCRKRHPNTLQQLRALLTKRFKYQSRVWSPFLIGVILPILIILVEQEVESDTVAGIVKSYATSFQATTTVLSFASFYPNENVFVEYDKEVTDLVNNFYLPILRNETAHVEVVHKAERLLADLGQKRYQEYIYAFALGGSFRSNKIVAWWNPIYAGSHCLSELLASTAVLRSVSGEGTARITVTAVIDNTYYDRNTSGITAKYDHEGGVISQWRNIYRGVAFPLITSFTAAVAVLFAIMERTSNCKALQLMSGMSSIVFWFSNLFFDAVTFVVTWIIMCIIFIFYNDTFTSTKVAALILLVPMACVTISISYLASFLYDTEGRAFALLTIFFTVGGTGTIVVAAYIWGITADGGLMPYIVHTVLTGLPTCIAPYSMLKLLHLDGINRNCLKYAGDPAGDPWVGLELYCAADQYITGLTHCCQQAQNGKAGDDLMLSPLSLAADAVGQQLIIMVIEGILFLAVILLLDSRSRRWNTEGEVQVLADSDAEAERALVEQAVASQGVSRYTLVVRRLKKQYPNVTAVRSLCFTVHNKECFGLLGVNGAGKSTTFQMLTGLVTPTAGDAYMGDMVMSKGVRQWQSRIGYCMQYGGLIAQLNAFETLYLFARLRGVPEKDIGTLVGSMIKVVDLSLHARKVSGSYSAGNKRKLSIAVAMIGLPELVFLDEPSAGVDVVARRKIFKVVKSVRAASGISMVLTSHSMDECEAACDRIAIMVAGEFQCLGSLQHLKEKMGQGYTLSIKLTSKDESQQPAFEAAVNNIFPGIQLTDLHQGLHEYHLVQMLPWSELFKRIAELRKHFALENVFVSDTTLERIFIGLARKVLQQEDNQSPGAQVTSRRHSLPSAQPSATHPAVPT